MARVLLVNPSYRNSYADSIGSLVNPIFPILALASLAAVAREEGHQIEILDLSWLAYDGDVFLEKVRRFAPTLVGFTVLTPGMNQVKDMTLLLKQEFPRTMTIAGGPHVSAMPEIALRESHLDAVVYGEGEETFRELLRGLPLSSVNGIAFRRGDDSIQVNPERSVIADLDQLPLPAWDLFDLNAYAKRTSRLFARRRPFVTAEFSRGCVYKCDFCASKLTMALGYRKKSPKRCADEVELMLKLGIREFMLADDIFTSDAKWAQAVCEEIVRRKLKIAWTCTNGIRVESAKPELFELMRRAGCYRVAFGFESGNDDVLRQFGKGGRASLAHGRTAVALAKRAKIETMGFFQMGLSSDTPESLQETIAFARDLELDMFKFGVTIAFPGTKMFNDFRQQGLVKSFDWDHYHIYSGKKLFAHPRLKLEEIESAVTKAYRATTFRSPRFIVRRFYRGFVTGDIFSDVLFFFRYLAASYLGKSAVSRYAQRQHWRAVDWSTDATLPRIREIS